MFQTAKISEWIFGVKAVMCSQKQPPS